MTDDRLPPVPTTNDGAAADDGTAATDDGVTAVDGERAVAAALRRTAAPPAPPADVSRLVADAVARADALDLVDVAYAVTDSPIGPLTVATTEVGLVRVAFGTEEGVVDELAAALSPRVLFLPDRLDDVRRQLDEYFAGRRHAFDVRLDRRLSRGYRRRVLEALTAGVGYGETATYKDLAVATGNPGAVRAVGTAMATNPIPIVVPCHRILRTGGSLGNYGGGPETKAWLLRHEGVRLLF
ncbi:MAG TPA: methylated-DNA--[protein]-cysteine S-methyltransferase [Acidimicrobiales bacterium]|nr:methylated-DNA--[protein]-cysteine S-methyltransferase [Acidimicrobiales bacterium]